MAEDVNEDQFIIRSEEENILVTSYLWEKDFSEERDGAFVRDDQLYDELEGYWEDSFFETNPSESDLEDALKDLEEEDLIDKRAHKQNYSAPEFYRLTEKGGEVYEEIKSFPELNELDSGYSNNEQEV